MLFELTGKCTGSIWVNPLHVQCVYRDVDGQTIVDFGHDDMIRVQEELREVVEGLKACCCQ